MDCHEQQWFIGFCRSGFAARGVCLDFIGKPLSCFAVGWSPMAIRRFVEAAKKDADTRGIEVVVGVEAELLENEPELAFELAQSGVRVDLVDQWMVDALWRSHLRRRQTAIGRARCIAQVLLIAECPPRSLSSAAPMPEKDRCRS